MGEASRAGIQIKSRESLDRMKEACRITAAALAYLAGLVAPGVTTQELDRKAHAFFRDHGAEPSFLGYNGYPCSICTSVNEQVVHGIPGSYVLQEGDIVSIDAGAYVNGYHGDAARTFAVGDIAPEAAQLIRVTRECFFQGAKAARAGAHVSDISRAVEAHARGYGYGVVRELTGHGIGRRMHEEPSIPNYLEPRQGRGARLRPGMTLAIEPMINLGGRAVKCLADGWTVVTRDGSLSAHYENTIAVTEQEPLILTLLPEEVV